jgi:hypothetical protein
VLVTPVFPELIRRFFASSLLDLSNAGTADRLLFIDRKEVSFFEVFRKLEDETEEAADRCEKDESEEGAVAAVPLAILAVLVTLPLVGVLRTSPRKSNPSKSASFNVLRNRFLPPLSASLL